MSEWRRPPRVAPPPTASGREEPILLGLTASTGACSSFTCAGSARCPSPVRRGGAPRTGWTTWGWIWPTSWRISATLASPCRRTSTTPGDGPRRTLPQACRDGGWSGAPGPGWVPGDARVRRGRTAGHHPHRRPAGARPDARPRILSGVPPAVRVICPTRAIHPHRDRVNEHGGHRVPLWLALVLRCQWACGGLVTDDHCYGLSDVPMPALDDEADPVQVRREFLLAAEKRFLDRAYRGAFHVPRLLQVLCRVPSRAAETKPRGHGATRSGSPNRVARVRPHTRSGKRPCPGWMSTSALTYSREEHARTIRSPIARKCASNA